MKRIRDSGITLVEVMIVIAIIGILAAMAAPSFSAMLEKQRITGAAEAVLADLRWARAEAIKRNKNVRVTFTTGSGWGYRIEIPPFDSASTSDDLKTVSGSDFPSTTLSTASFAGGVAYTTFDPIRGTNLNIGTATITSSNFSAGVIVSTLGRVRICGTMGGYDACS